MERENNLKILTRYEIETALAKLIFYLLASSKYEPYKEYKNNITENQNINYYNSNLTTIKYFDLKKYVKNITRNNFIDKYKDEYFKDTSIDPNASNLINKINKRIEEIEKQEFLDNKNNIG